MRITKTKIIATIGPSTNEYLSLKDLHAAGMNVARINMSHASQTDALKIIESIQKINRNQSQSFGPIGILLDTQGPEIRTGINQSDIDLQTGDIVNLSVRDDVDVETSSIKINYKGLIKSVDKGSKISIDNGLLNFKVLAKDNESLKCKVLDGGTLGSKRHVNLPGVRVDLPSITKKDRKDINFGIKHNVSFIALSFVRSAQDISNLRAILKRNKSSIKIIAKIENQEGLENIHEITQAADIVMVARGDLGIETDLADLPNIQRRIMYATAKWGRRSIVATHLLESMIHHPTPTRAEVTDVANAVYQGSDAVMLSEETAMGTYPIEAVSIMREIVVNAEQENLTHYSSDVINKINDNRNAIGNAIIAINESINIDAIVVMTESGSTAAVVSQFRPNANLFAMTPHKKVCQRLTLVWGIVSLVTPKFLSTDDMLISAEKILKDNKYVCKDDVFILTSGVPVGVVGSTNMLKIQKVTD